jgi:hypothetical protein
VQDLKIFRQAFGVGANGTRQVFQAGGRGDALFENLPSLTNAIEARFRQFIAFGSRFLGIADITEARGVVCVA